MKLGQKSFGKEVIDVLLVAIANSGLSTEKGAVNDEETIGALCRSIVLLWFAGFSSTAVTRMNASFEIGLEDSLRDALIAEQDQIISNAAAGDQTVTYEQITSQMPLFDSFLQEILRLHPPGHTTEDGEGY